MTDIERNQRGITEGEDPGDPAGPAGPGAAAAGTPDAATVPPARPATAEPDRAGQAGAIPAAAEARETRAGGATAGRAGLVAGLVAIAIAIAIGAWSMQRFQRIEGETTRRLQSAEQKLATLDTMIGQSRDLLSSLQSRSAVLEGKLAETAGLQAQVEKLFQDRAEDSLDVALAEAESGLALAAQQLALGADVETVLAAVQNIDARLARESDPRLAPVRLALARDIERLRVHPASDISRLALRIDALIAALDHLPLRADIRTPVESASGLVEPQPLGEAAAPPPVAEPASTVDRLIATLSAFGRELRSLFRVREIDSPEAVLIAPRQAYFLRQNLHLTLLNARLALLSRNGEVYRADLERARRWIDRYYDGEHRNVAAVQGQLRQMLDAKLAIEPPRIDDSTAAVRQARAAMR